MNHQLFENWLLSDEILSVENQQLLQEHLRTCDACQILERSWKEVDGLLAKPIWLAPRPGFTQRWLQKYSSERLEAYRRRATWMFVFYVAGAALLAFPLVLMAVPISGSPIVSIWMSIYRLTALIEYLNGIFTFTQTVYRTMIISIPVSTWISIVTAIFGLEIGWIAAYRRFTAQRRVAK